MRLSKIVVVIVFGLLLLSCGGDIHEVRVQPPPQTQPARPSTTIKARPKVPPSTIPRSTTTTTVDPKVRALQILSWKIKAGVAHSDAWWHGVSVCEQGGRNNSYYGYFSIMDGSAGGLDWNTQVDMANRIIARHGDYAWASGCVAAGYRAAPNG